MVRITRVENGNLIRLPDEWVAEMGLRDTATLEMRPEGVLIRSRASEGASWDTLFVDKLVVPPRPSDEGRSPEEELDDLSGDDLLF
jgi:hypothetical protein